MNKELDKFVEDVKDALGSTPIIRTFHRRVLEEASQHIEVLCKQLKAAEAEQDKLIEENRWRPASEIPELFDIYLHSKEVLIAGVAPIPTGWFEKERGWRSGDGTVEIFPIYWKPIVLP